MGETVRVERRLARVHQRRRRGDVGEGGRGHGGRSCSRSASTRRRSPLDSWIHGERLRAVPASDAQAVAACCGGRKDEGQAPDRRRRPDRLGTTRRPEGEGVSTEIEVRPRDRDVHRRTRSAVGKTAGSTGARKLYRNGLVRARASSRRQARRSVEVVPRERRALADRAFEEGLRSGLGRAHSKTGKRRLRQVRGREEGRRELLRRQGRLSRTKRSELEAAPNGGKHVFRTPRRPTARLLFLSFPSPCPCPCPRGPSRTSPRTPRA